MFHNYLVKSKDKGHEDNNAISEIISTHFSNQSWDIKFVDRKGRGDFPIHYSNIELTKIYHFLSYKGNILIHLSKYVCHIPNMCQI